MNMKSVKQVVRVQPGHRVEVVAPELKEGSLVNVVIAPCGERNEGSPNSVLAFLDALPVGPRAFASWEEYEIHLRQERDAWDR